MTETSDQILMEAVSRQAGPYLRKFAPSSSVPEAFWAALTANESGEDLLKGTLPASIQRKEQSVFTGLALVAGGFQEHFYSLRKKDLSQDVGKLVAWASSWGFTQVMGYNTILWGNAIDDLRSPVTHYWAASKLMAQFIEQFNLDPQKDFEAMARCWNTGSPEGKTYSENYVPDLMRRMELWPSVGDAQYVSENRS